MKAWIITVSTCIAFTMMSVLLKSDHGAPGEPKAYANPANPYEFVGVYHNEGLDAIQNSPRFPCVDPVQRFEIFSEYLKAKYPDLEPSYTDFGSVLDFATDYVDLTPEDAIARLTAQGLVSSAVAPKVHRMLELLWLHTEAGSTPVAFAKEMIKMESELLDRNIAEYNALQEETETALLLASSALARYSYAYWYEAASTETNGWNIVLDGGCGNNNPNDGVWAKGGKNFLKRLRQAFVDTISFFNNDCDSRGLIQFLCRLYNAGTASATCCGN